MKHRPTVRGLQLCQQMIVEEGTRNYTLVNCFTRLEVERVPSDPFEFLVHAMVGDGMGEVEVTVLIHRVADLAKVYTTSARITFKDRLSDYRLRIRVRGLIFKAFGKYEVSLAAEREQLALAFFNVVQRRKSS